MAKKITMQHIADRLGVSKYTVSQALAGKPGVSEATRREVVALAGALGYDLGAAGSFLPKEALAGEQLARAGEELLLFVGLDERHVKEPTFWKRVIEGIEAGCRMQGLTPSFFTFDQKVRTFEELLEPLGVVEFPAKRALGFIIAGSCPLGTLLLLARLGLPMVLADHEAPLSGADAVLNANSEAGRMACHHLLSQDCRSLAFLGRDSFAVSFRERWWGCRLAVDETKEALRAATAFGSEEAESGRASWKRRSLTVPQLKKWTIPYGNPLPRTWQTALERRLAAAVEEGTMPDGFICANDDIALYLLQLLEARELKGIRVVGIDNTAAGMEAVVPLTTVDLAKEGLGIRAVEAFARKLRHPYTQPEKIILSARLVVRNSG